MKCNCRGNPSPQKLHVWAPGAPQTPHALGCGRKFARELAFCSQVSNRHGMRPRVTVADTQPRLHWCPAPDTPSAAGGAGGRVPSPPLSPGTRRAPLPAATLGPTRRQRTPAGARAGRARRLLARRAAGSVSGRYALLQSMAASGGERAASANRRLRGKRKREAVPAPASNSEGFVHPNCQE